MKDKKLILQCRERSSVHAPDKVPLNPSAGAGEAGGSLLHLWTPKVGCVSVSAGVSRLHFREMKLWKREICFWFMQIHRI